MLQRFQLCTAALLKSLKKLELITKLSLSMMLVPIMPKKSCVNLPPKTGVLLSSITLAILAPEGKKCGIVINYKKGDVARAVIKLMKDKHKLKIYRKNAIDYAEQFDWDKIFTKTFGESSCIF